MDSNLAYVLADQLGELADEDDQLGRGEFHLHNVSAVHSSVEQANEKDSYYFYIEVADLDGNKRKFTVSVKEYK